MESSSDLQKTYSLEQQRLGDGLEEVTTPHTLVRSVTQRSVRSLRSQRSRPGVESVRAPRVKDLDYDDCNLEIEKEDQIEEVISRSPTPARSSCSQVSSDREPSEPVRQIIRFEDDDPQQPNNWPQWKKLYAIFVAIISVMNSTMNSSLAAGATIPISRHFHETNESALILPTSIYLVGYAFGPMIWGPLSESYGRKWTMIAAFTVLTIFSIASSLSPNFAALVIFRFLVGVGGSCAISVVGGICADVYHDPVSRGRSMAIFMAATTFGPILGPPISGFISTISWSWTFWIGAIFAGASFPLFFFFQETYAPAILKYRARRLRKETGNENIIAPLELEKTDLAHIITVVITRPLRMICFEPLVLFTCLYLSYAYAIFYIFFQSYPLIFTGIYNFSAGEQGLTFLPIGIGAIFAAAFYLTWDLLLLRAQKARKPWAAKEEYRRMPLACIAGPFFVLSSFWLGWTSKPDIHWMVPCIAGLWFGIGYLCLFMALLNYLVDAYEVFAASAMAAASLSRSTFGAVLPFAAKPMYKSLGIAWASSLLGFFSVLLCFIPWAFFRWGGRLREKSRFCQYLAQKKREEMEVREREREERRRKERSDEESGQKEDV